MFAAVALVAYLVQPGDTLSGIAASHGDSLAAVEAANPQISDPNMIYAGQTVEVPRASSSSKRSRTVQQSARSSGPSAYVASSVPQSSSDGSGSLSDIPGVPKAYAACVAYRESTDLQNPAADGNAYGIMPSSGYDVRGASLAYQKRVFEELYQQYGSTPWAADGCPGT